MSSSLINRGLEPNDINDTFNASLLVSLHGESLRFVAKWKKWLVFSAQQHRWVLDDATVLLKELAKSVGKEIQSLLADAHLKDLKDWVRVVRHSLSSGGITSMVMLARGIEGIPLDHEALDADPWLLGVQNGVLDLRTGKLRDGQPGDMISFQCPTPYHDFGIDGVWQECLEQWFPDEDLRDYFQRLCGSALVGAQQEHIMAIHFGHGRNGKGTAMRALQKVLGPYACVPHLSLLMRGQNQQHDTVRADLFRRRLAIANETARRVALDEASVKNLTGGDRISARRMHENLWEFDPSHTLFLCTNHLPEISGRDEGIWARIKVLEWKTTFTGKEDLELDQKLKREAIGILYWLVEGCLEWQKRGLDEPECVKRATLQYRQAEDRIQAFVEDVGLELDTGLRIKCSELQDLLEGWAQDEGLKLPQLRSDFTKWLQDYKCQKRQIREIEHGKKKRFPYWYGIGLTPDPTPKGVGQ